MTDKIHTILHKTLFAESIKHKKAHFLLASCVTKTCEIEGITQAGIPGFIPHTPTLDAEFITTGKVFSMPSIAQTPKGVPTPALITRAVEELAGFEAISILDLGLGVEPQLDNVLSFGISPCASIYNGADIDAKEIVAKGIAFGQSFVCEGEYVLLGESTPSGTTTAKATAKALGFDVEGLFSSSFKNVPNDIKEQTISQALSYIDAKMSVYEKLSFVSDNMLLFCAGFISAYSQRHQVVLCGGTQMATMLLVVDALGLEINTGNVALVTTKWVAEDTHSDIKALLEQLGFSVSAYYSDFDFSHSHHPALKLYDEGEAKEGVGAGGALVYAYLHNISQEAITKQVEAYLG